MTYNYHVNIIIWKFKMKKPTLYLLTTCIFALCGAMNINAGEDRVSEENKESEVGENKQKFDSLRREEDALRDQLNKIANEKKEIGKEALAEIEKDITQKKTESAELNKKYADEVAEINKVNLEKEANLKKKKQALLDEAKKKHEQEIKDIESRIKEDVKAKAEIAAAQKGNTSTHAPATATDAAATKTHHK
jgi:hypothetical protein